MDKSIALYDSDVFYATRFMEYFKKKKDCNFNISVFTKKDSLDEYIQTHTVEILVVGDQMKLEDILTYNIKYIYQLTDQSGITFVSEHPTINKYQSAQSVMQEILKDYHKKEKDSLNILPSSTIKLISIIAPKPAAEILAFAWSLSSLISDQKSVLLVILDPLPVQLLTAVDSTSVALTEIIYYLKENPNINLKMKTLTGQVGNVSYLSGISHGADILSLNKLDMSKWVKELRTNSDYQTIIFYLAGYTEAMLEMMGLSDMIISPSVDSGYNRAMLSGLTQQLARSGMELRLDRVIKVNLREEMELGKGPIAVNELCNTFAWSSAKENLNVVI